MTHQNDHLAQGKCAAWMPRRARRPARGWDTKTLRAFGADETAQFHPLPAGKACSSHGSLYRSTSGSLLASAEVEATGPARVYDGACSLAISHEIRERACQRNATYIGRSEYDLHEALLGNA